MTQDRDRQAGLCAQRFWDAFGARLVVALRTRRRGELDIAVGNRMDPAGVQSDYLWSRAS